MAKRRATLITAQCVANTLKYDGTRKDVDMDRQTILESALETVTGHRVEDYGKPEDNFKTIADMWKIYKGVEFSAHDVAMMMALLKVARIKSGHNVSDSYIDLAGYAACAAEIGAQ